MMTEMEAIFTLFIMGIVYLGLFGLAIAQYVMTALGYYGIADALGISNPWLAWLPFGSDWILGRVTEEQDKKKGVSRKWGRILLVLSLVVVIGMVVAFVGFFVKAFVTAFRYGYLDEEQLTMMLMGDIIIFYLAVLAISLVATVLYACQYICYYKIFESIVPKKSLKYFVLSILVPLAHGICLLKCKALLKPALKPAMELIQPAAPAAEEPVIAEPVAEEAPEETEE